ncbi:hypothetical protein FGD67_00350 [Colwellia sp. M166]|uniref:hypothetical protein n=1 Tax=Colwellia sp. M166 TaxID=2583805 RepID=UPI00211EBDBD|nr:hypothetical protein [Colwellia sp. M166]UUO21815.1 hypothetical protein FGD67_00350 [Colwellia sp. M166]|tara:strand:+ start:19031 stop:19297 length:267 start_codon:yes stop_codon:yes gene_type:complete
MNNILKISAIAILAFVTHNSHATELVKAQAINTDELVEVAKLNLAQSIKFNTIAINPIEKTARAQVTMSRGHSSKNLNNIIKTITLAE